MELRIGALSNYTPARLADRAASHIVDLASPHAVCIDPRGRVTVEPYDRAVFEDVVGVYAPGSGLIAIYRAVAEDLAFAIERRGIVADTSHRRADAKMRRAA